MAEKGSFLCHSSAAFQHGSISLAAAAVSLTVSAVYCEAGYTDKQQAQSAKNYSVNEA